VNPAGGSPVMAAGDGAVTPEADGAVTADHLRRVFLGPRGGGTLRRRASDALSQAVAAVFIQRLFAAYLPPIWGWFTLTWMRRREYV
jgi:hypothetical protein